MYVTVKLVNAYLLSVIDDYEATEELYEDQELTIVKECLIISKDAVDFNLSLLPCHLIGRLGLMDLEGCDYIAKLLNQARRPHFDALIPANGWYF